MGLLMFPANALFRSPEPDGVLTLKAFLHDGLIPAILLLFLIPGAAYGWTTGKLRTSHDLVAAMTEAMKSMGGYMVLAFFASSSLPTSGKPTWASLFPSKVPMRLKQQALQGSHSLFSSFSCPPSLTSLWGLHRQNGPSWPPSSFP